MFVGLCHLCGFWTVVYDQEDYLVALFVTHFTRFFPVLSPKDRYGLSFQNVLLFGMRGNGCYPEIE